MNSFVALSIFVCAIVAISGDTCFKEGELDKKREEFELKNFAVIEDKCKEENPDLDDAGAEKCVIQNFYKAVEKCKADSESDDKKKNWECAANKLGIEVTEYDNTFDSFKPLVIKAAKDDRKKDVEDAITPSASEENFQFCASHSLAAICDEIKEMLEKIAKEHDKHRE